MAGYRGQGVQNPKRLDKGVKKISKDAETVLSVPKQKKPIPKDIKDYAAERDVIIKQEKIKMEDLKNW